jgi:hypothetical protein
MRQPNTTAAETLCSAPAIAQRFRYYEQGGIQRPLRFILFARPFI